MPRVVIQGSRPGRLVIMMGAETIGEQLHARAAHLGRGDCPPHEGRGVLG